MKIVISLLVQRFVTFLIMAAYCLPSFATTISDLVREEQIIAKSYLNLDDPVPIASQVTLTVDISIPMDAKFSQGTRINHFEIPNAVVLAQGPFALNSVSRINGKRYINQLWEIPIYPQKGGDYVIPPIVIEMGIEHEGEAIVGKLVTSPMTFSSFVPSPYISDEYHWLVAQEATLSENVLVTHVKKSNEQEQEQDREQRMLQVGDSIEREVTLSAQSSLAMLFPNLIDIQDYQSNGVKAYLSQGDYLDKEVRGTRSSVHTEKITLVVQEAGHLMLPEIEVVWWDTKSNKEKRLMLPSQEWQVKHSFASFIKAYSVQLTVLFIVLCALVIGLYRLFAEIKRRKETDTMPLWYQFSKAVKDKDWGRSESVIYRKIARDHNRLTIMYPEQSTEWQNGAQQLQIDRYQTINSESEKKNNVVFLWKKLR